MSERFLNIANRRRLRLFNIHCQNGRMFAFVHAADFDTLADAADKAGVTLAVTDKYGLPYVLRHYGRRVGFVAGFGLFCFMLWYLSLFTWFVDFVNLPETLAVSASDAVYAAGLRPGMLSSRIDGPMLELELEEQLRDFDFIKISRMGSNAQVYFSPSTASKHTVADDVPCDLIAAEGGEIVEIIAPQGTPMVQPGDVVYPGDTLVSGLFAGQEDKIRTVHASGEVIAMVDETFSENVSFRQTVQEPTGRVVLVNRLTAFGWEIPLFYGLPKGNYRRTYEEIPLTLLDFEMPFVLRREEWHELCYTEKTFSTDECAAQAEALLDRRIQAADTRGIVSDTRTVNETENGVRVTRYVTFLRSIAKEREMLFG